MIGPSDIRRKAENLYRTRFLCDWLDGRPMFPLLIPGNREPDDDHSAAIEAMHSLRAGAKERLGYGYTVEWQPKNSRKHGRNPFPRRILFETQDDFLRYLGKQREFSAFAAAVERIRARYPELISWVRSHRKRLIENATDVDGLLLVVDYLREHPKPGLFARELPLPLDTKFIQRNQQILREWLDVVLPPTAIHSHEEDFERRFGLRYTEPHVLVRFLDPDVQHACGSRWPECSLPLGALAELPAAPGRVLIVENKVNLLTLPPLKGTVALGGLGDGVVDLRLVDWLQRVAIWYWGDLDTDGLAILSRLRSVFPQTVSLMMDIETLNECRKAVGQPKAIRPIAAPAGLIASERAAFELCLNEGLWIEQEKLPHSYVIDVLSSALRGSEAAGEGGDL
jgi:hypothetical protein